jgi:hypothetical protein
MLTIGEVWAPVPGFPGYEVSNAGAVRSRQRSKAWKPLKGEIDKDGYIRVTLYRNRRQTKIHLHRLVAIVFVPGRTAERDFACHRNGKNTENHAGNLKWATQAENIADKFAHGTHQIGSKHPRAKIIEDDARAIKGALRQGFTAREVANLFGTTIHIVHDIAQGKSWRHV